MLSLIVWCNGCYIVICSIGKKIIYNLGMIYLNIFYDYFVYGLKFEIIFYKDFYDIIVMIYIFYYIIV